MHEWGDEWFRKYGKDLYEAIDKLENRIRKWSKAYVFGKEKWGCYSELAEILTKKGWKSIKDITIDDEIATLKDGEYLEYNHPIEVMKYHYKGKMYRLINRGLDIFVTPNHKLYVSKGSYFKNGKKRQHPFELITPDTYFGQDKRFKKNVNWLGDKPDDFFIIPKTVKIFNSTRKGKTFQYKKKYSDVKIETKSFLKFLGFYVAEGFTNNTCIYIAHNPITENELTKSLIKDLGYEPHTNRINSYKYFSQPLLAEWLVNNCGRGAENKKVPDFIKHLDKESIRLFLEYLYIGDGHKTKTSHILTTVSKQLADEVCELILKTGDTFRLRTRDRGGRISILKNKRNIVSKRRTYEINWTKNKEIEIETSKVRKRLIKSFKEEWVDFEGMVYCCNVPNHVVYIRQNGKGYWCGNSYRDEYLTLWDGGLFQILFGYKVFFHGWFERLVHKIDRQLIPVKKTEFGWVKVGLCDLNWKIGLTKIVRRWQKHRVNKAFQVTCKEYPHLVDELVCDVDCFEWIKPCKWGNIDGTEIHNKYWKKI